MITKGLWAAALVTWAAATPPREPVVEPGRTTERALGAGESHGYRIVCPAGTYVYAVVEQRGVDVVVTVSGPDGSELLRVDTPTEPSGREGSETVPFVAAHAGAYHLRVRALEPGASGTYALRVERRRATAEDGKRFEAWRWWSEGSRLGSLGSADALRQALQAYERSGQLLQELAEPYDAARVLQLAGDLARFLGETDRSVADYERVLSLSPAAARRLAAQAQLALGVGRRQLGLPERAREHYQQALETFRALQDDRGTGAALTGLAMLQWEDLGDAPEALRLLAQALDLGRSSRDGVLERAALHDMASIYDWSGEKQRALEFYQKAVDQERAAGDRLATALTLDEMGHLYTQWGDYPRARETHLEALDLLRQVGNRPHETWALLHIGRTHALEGDVEKALVSLGAALELSREIKDPTLEAHALSRLGEAYGRQGDAARAQENLRAAVELYRGSSVKYWPALAYVELGKACLQAGDAVAARAALVEGLEVARASGAAGVEAAAFRELARVALAQGDAEAALGQAATAVAAVESERVKIAREDFRTTYFASVHPYYQTYIDALMALDRKQPQAGNAATALHVSERARARRVLEALAESAVEVGSAADPALVARERQLRAALSALAARQAGLAETGATVAQRGVIDKKLRALEADRQEVLTRLRQGNPRYAALVQPSVLDAPEIQGQLEPGTALIEYALGEEKSHLWVVTATSLVARELPGGAVLDALARRVYQGLSARAEEAPSVAEGRRRAALADRKAAQAAAELARLILPLDLLGPAVKRLVVVADGALQTVPFAALPLPRPAGATGPSAPLVSRYEIVYAPSASWVAALRRLREGVPPPPKALAVLADPVFDRADSRVAGRGGEAAAPSDATLRRAVGEVHLRTARADGTLPRLLLSRREALAAATLVPRRDALLALDFEASRERATSPELAEYRIVHFATHALLNNDHPDLSGVVLSLVDRNGQPRDGFLRVQDVYDLRLPAELVVLSACQTAVGKAVPGEGLLGLARAFMYGGARRVAASLWPVDETATTELMTAFYRELLGNKRPPAEALRRAQLALASRPRWRAPYYWAGFVIHGDWR